VVSRIRYLDPKLLCAWMIMLQFKRIGAKARVGAKLMKGLLHNSPLGPPQPGRVWTLSEGER